MKRTSIIKRFGKEKTFGNFILFYKKDLEKKENKNE
jgi:hypothetical protein